MQNTWVNRWARHVPALLSIALTVVCADVAAQTYTYTGLGTPAPSYSDGTAINAVGQVAGVSNLTASGAARATLWNGTTRVELDSGPYSTANSTEPAPRI